MSPPFDEFHSWFFQGFLNGRWLTFSPSHDEYKIRKKYEHKKAEFPETKWRLVRETVSYTVLEGEGEN